MHDKIFGDLHYEYGWNGTIVLDWFGEESVDLVVSGEEDDAFDSLQYEAFQSFINDFKKIKNQIVDKVLEYYRELRYDLGYDDGSNDEYPEISDAEQMIRKINLNTVVIPQSGIYDGRCVALAFECDWDCENGLGVRLINENVAEVGYQDIVF